MQQHLKTIGLGPYGLERTNIGSRFRKREEWKQSSSPRLGKYSPGWGMRGDRKEVMGGGQNGVPACLWASSVLCAKGLQWVPSRRCLVRTYTWQQPGFLHCLTGRRNCWVSVLLIPHGRSILATAWNAHQPEGSRDPGPLVAWGLGRKKGLAVDLGWGWTEPVQDDPWARARIISVIIPTCEGNVLSLNWIVHSYLFLGCLSVFQRLESSQLHLPDSLVAEPVQLTDCVSLRGQKSVRGHQPSLVKLHVESGKGAFPILTCTFLKYSNCSVFMNSVAPGTAPDAPPS